MFTLNPREARALGLGPEFGESLRRAFGDLEGLFREVPGAGVSLPISLWRDDERLFVEADLPGVKPEDLEIVVQDGKLHLRGERKAPETSGFAFNTRSFGKFEQVVLLPKDIDGDSADASFHEGVLRVTLTRKAETRPRRVSLRLGGGGAASNGSGHGEGQPTVVEGGSVGNN